MMYEGLGIPVSMVWVVVSTSNTWGNDVFTKLTATMGPGSDITDMAEWA